MSEIQTHIGKLKRISSFKSIDEFENWICKQNIDITNGKDKKYNYTLYYDFQGNLKYVFFTPKFIYEIIDNEIPYEGDINFFQQNSENEYNYVFQYYDGGTCFGEVLSEHLSQIKKSIK